jgi:hypothetical protein
MPLTIPLLCGDPAGQEPASFTRFVLPFGYQLEAGGAREGPAWQVETAAVSPARQRYFTTETSRVLFRRARRFVLQDASTDPEKRLATAAAAAAPEKSMSGVEKRDLGFFLGGHDLEMATVRELLERSSSSSRTTWALTAIG